MLRWNKVPCFICHKSTNFIIHSFFPIITSQCLSNVMWLINNSRKTTITYCAISIYL
jgi:hypothetical protein